MAKLLGKDNHSNEFFTSKELAYSSFLLLWNNLENKNVSKIVLGFTQNKTFGMYIGVKKAIEELKLNIQLFCLEDIPNIYNNELGIFDFFKIPKDFLNNSLLFDNTPYSKAIKIVEYCLKIKNLVFALSVAGFTGNNFVNKFNILYIYLTNSKYYDKNNSPKNFPTVIVCNSLNKITSDFRKKKDVSKIDKYKDKKVLSTTDIISILKYIDIEKKKIIRLSKEFYGGIRIKF